MKNKAILLICVFIHMIVSVVQCQLPIADGKSKFLGCAYSSLQEPNFGQYWNQITPENGGKWGSVESTRDNMNWTEIDAAYAYAMANDIPFRLHVLVWGNQQPNWIAALDSAQQHEEIEEWFSLCGGRFPDADYIEVVNEPFHDPPDSPADGGYIGALGGTGVTGFDWVLEAFRMARIYFPTANLILNEYGIENDLTSAMNYRNLAQLLKDSSLIDGIGIQAHAFSTESSAATLQRMVDTLATLDLPIQVTEMDIDGPTDLIQVLDYQRIFPVYWNHPAITGITLWGYRWGLWRTTSRAYIVYSNGTERPAIKWLRAWVDSSFVPATEISVSTQEGVSVITTDNGVLNMIATVLPDTATIDEVQWTSSNPNIASIDEEGVLSSHQDGTVTITATVEDGSGTSNTMDITISNQVVGVDFTDYLESLELYPNPVTDGSITIPVAENLSQVRVLNLMGNTVFEQNIAETGSAIIKMNCKPGIYILQLSGKGHEVYRKIVVQ